MDPGQLVELATKISKSAPCGQAQLRWQSWRKQQTRLSKFGNVRLRRTLWIAGQVAIRQRENGFRHKFERYIARDRDDPDLRPKAMTAITAKMARASSEAV